MISLFLSPNQADNSKILDKVSTLSLKVKIIYSEEYTSPILKENKETFTGIAEIEEHLDKISIFLKQWYACLCD